jgi:hypothetical protein
VRHTSVEARAMRELLDARGLPDSAAPAVERSFAFRWRCLGVALADAGAALRDGLPRPVKRLLGWSGGPGHPPDAGTPTEETR